MVVNVEVTPSDLLRATWRLSLSHKSTWLSWLFLASLILIFLLLHDGIPSTSRDWAVLSVTTILGASAGVAVAFAFSTVAILSLARKTGGALGRQVYTLSDAGLLRRTDVSETLLKRGGVRELQRSSDALFIGISQGLFYVIPRRSFATTTDFEVFWQRLQQLYVGDA